MPPPRSRTWEQAYALRLRFERPAYAVYSDLRCTSVGCRRYARVAYIVSVPIAEYEPRLIEMHFRRTSAKPAVTRVYADGPTSSPHRYAPQARDVLQRPSLCIWYPGDRAELRWVPSDGLLSLIEMTRVHLFKEAYWRETGEWLAKSHTTSVRRARRADRDRHIGNSAERRRLEGHPPARRGGCGSRRRADHALGQWPAGAARRLRELYAGGWAAVQAYKEFAFAVRRRNFEDRAGERVRISEALREVQKDLAFYEALIGRERSDSVASEYRILVAKTREIAGVIIRRSWDEEPIDSDKDMHSPQIAGDLRALRQFEDGYMSAITRAIGPNRNRRADARPGGAAPDHDPEGAAR